MDPLSKSSKGYEYLLVMVNYTTHYPEAVPLQKVTSKNVARELVLLFSRVGLLKDPRTHQGTPFMSKLMMDVCWLLQVKQVQTSVYHPQTDRLIKHFNQTPKRMLH